MCVCGATAYQLLFVISIVITSPGSLICSQCAHCPLRSMCHKHVMKIQCIRCASARLSRSFIALLFVALIRTVCTVLFGDEMSRRHAFALPWPQRPRAAALRHQKLPQATGDMSPLHQITLTRSLSIQRVLRADVNGTDGKECCPLCSVMCIARPVAQLA